MKKRNKTRGNIQQKKRKIKNERKENNQWKTQNASCNNLQKIPYSKKNLRGEDTNSTCPSSHSPSNKNSHQNSNPNEIPNISKKTSKISRLIKILSSKLDGILPQPKDCKGLLNANIVQRHSHKKNKENWQNIYR